MIQYERIIVDTKAYLTVKQDVLRGELGHAYIVICNDNALIETFFLMCGMTIMCDNDNSCYSCNSCLRVLNNSHTAIQHLREEKGLKVEDIENLISDTILTTVEKKNRKIYFIYNGEKMNTAAQNKLLKTFEEAPNGITIFIAADNESSLLSTIKSRGKKLHIVSISSESIAKELQSQYPKKSAEEIEYVAYSVMGNVHLAKKLLVDKDYRKLNDNTLDMIMNMNSSSNIAKYIEHPLMSKTNIAKTIDIMLMAYSEALSYKAGKRNKSKQREQYIMNIADKYSEKALVGVLEVINSAKEKLFFNANEANVIDSMLFSILEVRYKCK